MSSIGGGGGFGGGFGGARAPQAPFAGVPPELRSQVEEIKANEPEHDQRKVPFDQRGERTGPFTVRSLLRPHRLGLAGALALITVETLTMQVGPLLAQIAIDHGIRPRNTDVLVAVTVAYLVAIVTNVFVTRARVRVTSLIGERILERLRIRVFSHLQRLSLDYYGREPAGRTMTRMTSDIEALGQLFHEGLVQLVAQGLVLVAITGVLFFLDPRLAAFTLLAVLPAMTVITIWFRARSDEAYRVVRDRISDVVGHLAESLAGVRVVNAFNRHRHNVLVHRDVVGDYRRANGRTARLAAIYSGGTELTSVAGHAVVLAVGGAMVLRGTLTIGALTAFVLYLTQLFAPIQQLVQVYNNYQRGQAGMNYLRMLLSEDPSVPEAPDARELPAVQGRLELRGVSFAYGDGPRVLHDIDLDVAPGETLAVVGPTGAGKSTIAKLLVRFVDPAEGVVAIDGHDLREVTFASLRGQVVLIPQEPFLFIGTLRDNLAFARPGATDEELHEACDATGLGDLVARRGLDSAIEQRGATLAAGERQLIALARTLVARPRALVLDEATSSLDPASEAKVERAVDELLAGRTAVVIAHRLSTAQRADRIAVIEDGRVAELGTPGELLAQDGRYAELYRAWHEHGGDGLT